MKLFSLTAVVTALVMVASAANAGPSKLRGLSESTFSGTSGTDLVCTTQNCPNGVPSPMITASASHASASATAR